MGMTGAGGTHPQLARLNDDTVLRQLLLTAMGMREGTELGHEGGDERWGPAFRQDRGF